MVYVLVLYSIYIQFLVKLFKNRGCLLRKRRFWFKFNDVTEPMYVGPLSDCSPTVKNPSLVNLSPLWATFNSIYSNLISVLMVVFKQSLHLLHL